jgi:hypothetical protein
MLDTISILNNAAEKSGFIRARFSDKDVPTDISNVTVFVYFGDIRHASILSSVLLKRYREESKGSKYFILCSWDGMEGLFPYVSEYWGYKGGWKSLYPHVDGWKNKSEALLPAIRSLNRYFSEITDFESFLPYYDNGLKELFFDKYNHVKRFRVSLPSATVLGNDFNRDLSKRPGNKILLFPSLTINTWKMGRVEQSPVAKSFWISLAKKLKNEGYTPVVLMHGLTHNISSDLPDDCVYLSTNNLLHAMSAMRTVGCVLDVFSGISRLAILARTPYVCCDERVRYGASKEYEIDDLCGADIPREYVYSFSQIHTKGEHVWENNLFDMLVHKLNMLFVDLNRDSWPSASQGEEVIPYSTVRKIKSKIFGTKFIKIEKNLPVLD